MSGIDATRSLASSVSLGSSAAARSALASLAAARANASVAGALPARTGAPTLDARAGAARDLRGGAPAPDPHVQLRHLANQLEAVFLDQLFQAMRDAVPQGESSDPAGGEAVFTRMFDERVASEAAEHARLGLGDALYRQLSRRLSPEATPGAQP